MYISYLLAAPVGNLSNPLHLLQMLLGVVGMDHLVLNSDVVSSEQHNLLTSRVIKVRDVVNHTINDNFVAAEVLDVGNAVLFRTIVVLCRGGNGLALSELVGVGGHDQSATLKLSFFHETDNTTATTRVVVQVVRYGGR